jgi:hypothetical protein
MTTTEHTSQIQDSELAVTDAGLIQAGIEELHAALLKGHLDSITVTDVARVLLPKLDALKAWLEEQIVEVTL